MKSTEKLPDRSTMLVPAEHAAMALKYKPPANAGSDTLENWTFAPSQNGLHPGRGASCDIVPVRLQKKIAVPLPDPPVTVNVSLNWDLPLRLFRTNLLLPNDELTQESVTGSERLVATCSKSLRTLSSEKVQGASSVEDPMPHAIEVAWTGRADAITKAVTKLAIVRIFTVNLLACRIVV